MVKKGIKEGEGDRVRGAGDRVQGACRFWFWDLHIADRGMQIATCPACPVATLLKKYAGMVVFQNNILLIYHS